MESGAVSQVLAGEIAEGQIDVERTYSSVPLSNEIYVRTESNPGTSSSSRRASGLSNSEESEEEMMSPKPMPDTVDTPTSSRVKGKGKKPQNKVRDILDTTYNIIKNMNVTKSVNKSFVEFVAGKLESLTEEEAKEKRRTIYMLLEHIRKPKLNI